MVAAEFDVRNRLRIPASEAGVALATLLITTTSAASRFVSPG